MSTVYYSPLSSLVPQESFPEALGFVKDGLIHLLDDVYFKDLQHTESPRGDAAQYALTIVSLKALEVEVPGTGIFLVLNPGHTTGSTSELPITLRYEWPVLAWINAFDLESFSWQPGDFFQLVLTVLNLTERQVLERALTVFTGAADPIGDFVTDYNDFFAPDSITVPTGADPVGELKTAIEAQRGEGSALIVFAMYVLDEADISASEEKLETFFSALFGGSVKDWFLRQITPRIDATLDIGAGIRFPRNILVPLDETTGEPLPAPATSLLRFHAGTFGFSTETGIGYDGDLTVELDRSQIGDTGFEIEIEGAKLDLSRTTNIPEASADGRPEDFVGVFVEKCDIKLPAFFNEDSGNSSAHLIGRNLLIGTGGLSGTIALEAVDPNDATPSLIKGKFGSGFELGLSAASVTFQQNAIIESSIKGYMLIPGFKDTEGNDAEIQIDVSIGSDGNFSVTASEEQSIEALSIPDVVDVEIKSVSVGREGGRFFVAVAGALDFAPQPGIGEYIPDKIEIQKLTIWDDGKIEIAGGSIVLPKAATLQIGAVAIAITALHFGTLEQDKNGQLRKYAFFGFDGGLSIDPGGVDARGDGIKLYFTTDVGPGKPLDVFLRITSIAIDIVIPGSATAESAAVILSGYLSMKEDGQGSTEYVGGVAVSLPKLHMAGSAAMRYNPRLPSFVVDLGLEISTPILLGATGLGIYGFRGLFGMRYVAKKTAVPGLTDESEWWQYYKAKVPPDNREGIQVSKFSPEEGLAIGAGVSLATAPDAGATFSSKLFFLLSLPDVFLLQGQAQILKQRIGLDTTEDPPFFALIAISSSSVEAAFGVDYKIPEGGEIATFHALLELGFFFGNSGAWYINLGRDEPADRRVSAVLLTLFDAYFYLMLSSTGVRAGAGVSYELKKKIGPFKVELSAHLDMAARISFKPVQAGGSIELGGHLGLSIFGVGFSFSASAALTGEAPKPFIVTGRLKACVKILWSKKCVKIELTWTFDSELNYSEVELLPADLTSAVQAVNVLTLESYPLFAAKSAALPAPALLDAHIIPMDSYIDLELRQAVHPDTGHPSLKKFVKLGGAPEYQTWLSPQKAKSPRVRHEFTVDSIEIMSWDPGAHQWKPYDVYAAATPLQLAPFVTADLSTLAWGYWQKTHGTKHKNLRVLAETPFSYVRPGTPFTPPEDLGISVGDVFCAPPEREMVCHVFTQSADVLPELWYGMPDVLYQVGAPGATIRRDPWQNVDNGLCIDQDNTITLLFPEPIARAELLLRTEAETVQVTWYRRVAPAYEWQAIGTVEVPRAELGDPVRYDDLAHPILRADIRGATCGKKTGVVVDVKELDGIESFLNELARRGDLANEKAANWNAEVSPLLLRGHVADSSGNVCDFELFPADGKTEVAWSKVVGVSDIGALADEPFGFSLQLHFDRDVLSVNGRSCHRVQTSGEDEPPIHCSEGDPKIAAALLAFLDALRENKHLLAPQLTLFPTLFDVYKSVFFHSALYDIDATKADRVLYTATWDPRAGTLFIRIRDSKSYDCTITLASEEGQAPVALDRIDRFLALVPDLSQGGDGPLYAFRVLVTIGGKEFWLRGTSCYPMGECHRGCNTCLYRVCYLTVADANYNDSLPTSEQVEEEAQEMVSALSGSIQPVWRPDTYFVMKVVATDTALNDDDNHAERTYNNTWMIGWRTAGPVGHFHRYLDAANALQPHPAYQALVLKALEDQFKLATLQHYLDFPRCYPNADGRLTNAKPLFYVNPRLDLFFVRPYVYEMYRDWDSFNGAQKIFSALELEIIDPAPPPGIPPSPPVVLTWDFTPPVSQPIDVAIIDNMISNGEPCGDVHPPGAGIDVTAGFTVPALKPLKLYTAVFRNAFRRNNATQASRQEVHRYVFQTSRYPDFAAQIGSWVLEADSTGIIRSAVYDVEVEADAPTLDAATSLLTDPATSSDELKQRFADPFDRLFDGIFRLAPLPPPVTTEFNVIRLAGRVLGILVRSPEPLNDPKMPAAELATTVRLSVDGGATGLYRGLHAKDAARVFVTNADHSMNVAAGTHTFTFEYRRWRGTAYVNEAVSTASFVRA